MNKNYLNTKKQHTSSPKLVLAFLWTFYRILYQDNEKTLPDPWHTLTALLSTAYPFSKRQKCEAAIVLQPLFRRDSH